ncbi:MAG TPA: acyl-CoA thioesterase [Bryobacteraceae bacterium]|jgi:4-hydroxybenzoyl-CoA thioesterase|nr:acyl-CoA thioesterase [Bryobacteraceae bacterium]
MLIYTRKVQIEFGDCDPAGIVYFPRYFVWFDNNTVGLFAAAGISLRQMLISEEIVGIPMVDARAKFYLPCTFGDEVTIETTIREFRRSSFDVYHRLFNRGELSAEGFETRVWAGSHPDQPGRLKSRPFPADLIARFD